MLVKPRGARCAGVAAEENPVALEVCVHDLMSLFGIKRFSEPYQLVLHQGIEWIQDQGANSFFSFRRFPGTVRLKFSILVPPFIPFQDPRFGTGPFYRLVGQGCENRHQKGLGLSGSGSGGDDPRLSLTDPSFQHLLLMGIHLIISHKSGVGQKSFPGVPSFPGEMIWPQVRRFRQIGDCRTRGPVSRDGLKIGFRCQHPRLTKDVSSFLHQAFINDAKFRVQISNIKVPNFLEAADRIDHNVSLPIPDKMQQFPFILFFKGKVDIQAGLQIFDLCLGVSFR